VLVWGRGLFWMRYWTFEFHKVHGIVWLAEELLSLFVCLFVGLSTGWSVSVLPKHSNPRHISHTPLATPSLHNLNTDCRFQQTVSCDKKIKQTLYRLGEFLTIPAVSGAQISRQSTHEGSRVVSPTHRPPLPHKIFLVLISVRSWVNPRATVRPEELCH